MRSGWSWRLSCDPGTAAGRSSETVGNNAVRWHGACPTSRQGSPRYNTARRTWQHAPRCIPSPHPPCRAVTEQGDRDRRGGGRPRAGRGAHRGLVDPARVHPDRGPRGRLGDDRVRPGRGDRAPASARRLAASCSRGSCGSSGRSWAGGTARSSAGSASASVATTTSCSPGLRCRSPAGWPAWRPSRVMPRDRCRAVRRPNGRAPGVRRPGHVRRHAARPGHRGEHRPVAGRDPRRRDGAGGRRDARPTARSHGSERRMLTPVLLAGAASMVSAAYTAQYAMQTLGFIPVVDNETIVPIAWVFNVVRVVVPLDDPVRRATDCGARGQRWPARSPTSARRRCGRAAGRVGDGARRPRPPDPRLGPRGGGLSSADGARGGRDELERLEHQPDRRVVRVDTGSDPLAVLVVARAVAEDPALLGAGVSLTRLVVRNERQRPDQEQLVDVRASRARIVEAAMSSDDGSSATSTTAPAADGGLAMQLRAAEGDRRPRAALQAGSTELLAILEDVRELARGIHPAVLTRLVSGRRSAPRPTGRRCPPRSTPARRMGTPRAGDRVLRRVGGRSRTSPSTRPRRPASGSRRTIPVGGSGSSSRTTAPAAPTRRDTAWRALPTASRRSTAGSRRCGNGGGTRRRGGGPVA